MKQILKVSQKLYDKLSGAGITYPGAKSDQKFLACVFVA